MTWLSTLFFWLVFVVTAPVVMLFGALLFVFTAPFDPQRRVMHAYICATAFNYVRVNPFWSTTVEGRERIPSGPCVLVVNHQSMADVIAVLGLRSQFKFVSKASLFSLPLVGWLMTMAKYVAVERGRHSSMQKMMDDCRAWLRSGMSVLIFPEGTYSPDGKLLPFKRGAFQLAVDEGVPVVPVVMTGTRDLVVEDGPWMSPKATVRIRVLEPLRDLGTDDAAVTQRVRELMLRELGQLPPGRA